MISALAAGAAISIPHEPDGIGFVGLAPKDVAWTYATAVTSNKVFQLDSVDPGFEWNQLVVSWNVDGDDGVSLEVKAKIVGEESESGMFSFGKWALGKGRRESVKDQTNDWGKMDTDTLILAKPARKVQLQLILTKPQSDKETKLRFVGLSFRNTAIQPPSQEPNRAAWGKTIEVPQKSQMSYPGGDVWCSPTCISMLLNYWSEVEGRPDMAPDVPEVVANVHDPNWPGTGNWPFNTAYAGSFRGMRAYVARFGSVAEIEDWIEAGVPVATSVSSAMLKGKPNKEPNDGHLVIVVGFTATGDLVFNDPGRSKEVRQTYKRSDFERAWRSSENTVYLVYPEEHKVPANRFRHWAE